MEAIHTRIKNLCEMVLTQRDTNWKSLGRLIFALLAGLAIATTVIYLLMIETRPAPEASGAYVKLAEYLRNSIDDTVNPCEDFYQYTCGRAYENMAHDETRISSSGETDAKVGQQLQSLLEDSIKYPLAKDSNDLVLAELRKYYASCMNETRLRELGAKPLLEFINKLTLGAGQAPFELLQSSSNNSTPNDESSGSHRSIADRIIELKKLGITNNNFLVRVDLTASQENGSVYGIYIGSDSLSLSAKMFLSNETFRQLDKNFTLDSIGKLTIGQRLDKNLSEQRVLQLQEFRMKLMRLQTDAGSEQEYANLTMKEFKSIVADWKFNYPQYVERLFQQDGYNLTDQDVVHVELRYLRELDKLLAQTELKIVDNYILYRLLHLMRQYLDSSWLGADRKDCVTIVQYDLSAELAYEYIKRLVDHKQRLAAYKMVLRIFNTTREFIERNGLFPGATKELALLKVDRMHALVGYFRWFMNPERRLYRSRFANLTADDFFGNHLRIGLWNVDKNYDSNGARYYRHWTAPNYLTTTGNAYYQSASDNRLIIPAAIINDRFFDRHAPMYFNFASLGFVAAHEIGHAFDAKNLKYDFAGDRRIWWTNETSLQFEKKKACFVRQYDGQPMPGYPAVKINGSLTLGENMADNYGIWLAYRAYKIWLGEQQLQQEALGGARALKDRAEPKLAGFNYTQDQLFWLSYARLFCDMPITNDYELFLRRENVHSPAKYRVNIPLSNNLWFASAFNCSKGSQMNPRETCSAWRAT